MVALGLNSLGRSSGRKFSSEESTSTSLPTVPHKPTHFPQTPYLQSLSSKPTQTPLEDNPSVKIDPFARNDGLQHSSIYNSFTSSNKSPISTSNSPATRYPSEKTKFPSTSSTFQQQKGPIHDNKHRRQDSEFSLDRQVVDIVADYIKPEKDFIDTASNKPNFKSNEPLSSSPLPTIAFGRQDRPVGSRQSSFADQSAPPSPLNTPSILSQESIVTPKLPTKNLPLPSLTNNMPRSNSHTNSAGLGGNIRRGGSRTSDRNTTNNNASPGMLERMEEADELRGLRNDSMPNIYNNQYDKNNFNQSSTSVSSKTKADKMLGIDSRNAKLASLYLVSGLGKSTAQWSFADSDSSRGVQPIEDSLGLFWRPEMLGSSFSGENQESSSSRARKESKSSTLSNGLSKDIRGKYVPDAGPDGPQRLVSKTIKFAHPRGIEVVNSTLSPPTTCHAFTFTIPRHDTLAAIARTRLNSAMSGNPNTYSVLSNVDETGNLDPSLHLQSRSRAGGPNIRNSSSSTSPTELTYYGVTLTVWTHADRERALQLKTIKMRNDRIKLGQGSLNSISPNKKGSSTPSENIGGGKKGTKRGSLHYMISKNQSEGDITASSETETGMSDSDLEGPLGRRGFIGGNKTRLSTVDSVPEDVAAAYDEASDIFWMPYAITMVSRFPIYDLLQDYLRLSWARFSKNAKVHMTQINRILNYNPPRPGESISLPVGEKPEDEVTIEGHMPGGLMDFEKGLMKIDFQLWPLFQAVDIDHILSAAEVALSNSGRIIFCSKHPAMLNVAVSTLKYVVELRGWDGICMPVIHARDATFIIEDPGPYIIGMPTECRYLLAPPPEVVIIDIDTNSLSCKSPPTGVITPRPKRDKMKQKLYAVLGNSYPMDRSVPMEFKVSYPKGNFKNFNKFNHKGERPNYLGERLKAPGWWRHEAVVSVFDKILADKHKKPTLIQRLMKSGVPRPQAQLSVGEQLAKAMMRRRALHYVETRDDLELKVAKINKRLLKLIQEGDHWKKQFEMFEKYADRLTVEANELKTKIEKERREAKRLSNLATEQTQQNVQLEEKLKNTEDARAEAMRQLSDMHHSIQELEREREEIMNSLETQINGALAGLPISSNDSNASSSRPSTPNLHNDTLSTMSSRGSTKSRPALAYSMISSQSKAMSVLGQVKGNNYNNQRTLGGHVHGNGNTKQDKLNKRASVMSSVTVDTERTSHNQSGSGISGNDAISQRIASVQAKLELALNVVSSQRSSSVMTTSSTTSSDDGSGSESGNETDTEDGNEGEPQKIRKTNNEEDVKDGFETDKDDQNNKTPTASRRPSDADIVSGGLTENKEVQPPLPKLPNNDNHESSQGDPVESSTANGTDDGNSKLKVSANITNRPTSASTIKPNPTSTSNSTPIIMKPRLRTKVNINTNDNKDGDTTKKHKIKVTRNITPPSGSESDASNLTAHHVHKEDDNEQQRHDEEVDSDGKRLSILSSRSIQFGQAV